MTDPGKRRVFPRWMTALFWIGGVGFLLYSLRGVLTPVFFAFLIAYMLDPVVDRFERRGIPRAAAIVLLLAMVLGALGLFLLLAVPVIVRDFSGFLGDLPRVIEALLARLEPTLAGWGIPVPRTLDEAASQLHLDGELAGKAVEPAGAALKWLLGGTASLLGALLGLLVIPVFAFYLLYDFDRIVGAVHDLVPLRWRPYVADVAREVDEVLGQFVRGQLIVMLILAVLYSAAYAVIGIRLAVVIGVVAGLLSFIPYVGGGLALGLAVLMSLLDWQGWGQLAAVVGAYSVIQLLESFVITPRVVGEKVGLSAIWVLFALMVGGELFGFLGVLLALPAAAVLKIFAVRGVATYRRSAFFREAAAPGEAGIGAILREEGLPDDPDLEARKRGADEPLHPSVTETGEHEAPRRPPPRKPEG